MPEVDWKTLITTTLCFVVGAGAIGIGISGLRNGKVIDRGSHCYRAEAPIMFAFTVAGWIGIGAFVLIAAVSVMLEYLFG